MIHALGECVVFCGPELEPWHCRRLAWEQDTIRAIERVAPSPALERGVPLVLPGLYNGHTHVGDAPLIDGATGLTLATGFFRPAGYKYRELARVAPEVQLAAVTEQLRYLARTGTVCHVDFREQGTAGAEMLRAASRATGVESVILSQFADAPFSADELEADRAGLPASAADELRRMLEVADGFSESTMNDLTTEAWRAIRRETGACGKRRAVHCLESPSYRETSLRRHGTGDLARALELLDPDWVVHLTCAGPEEIGLLAAAGKTAVLNPRANAVLGLPVPPVRPLLEAGVNLLLGTDNVMLNPPNLWAELDFTYKIARSQFGGAGRPAPREILRLATCNVRAALGGDHHGFLAPGLPASFVILDGRRSHLSPTRDLAATVVTRVTPEDVLATFRLGRALYRSSAFSS